MKKYLIPSSLVLLPFAAFLLALKFGWIDQWAATGDQLEGLAQTVAALVAILAVAAALYSLFDAQDQRQEEARPYIVVYLDRNPYSPEAIDIVFKNYGKTPGIDLIIEKQEEAVYRATGTSETPLGERIFLPNKISMLAPGQESRYYWDVTHLREETPEANLGDELHLSLTYTYGKKTSSQSFQLDIRDFRSDQTYMSGSFEGQHLNSMKKLANGLMNIQEEIGRSKSFVPLALSDLHRRILAYYTNAEEASRLLTSIHKTAKSEALGVSEEAFTFALFELVSAGYMNVHRKWGSDEYIVSALPLAQSHNATKKRI